MASASVPPTSCRLTAKMTTVEQIEQLVRISREFGRDVANGKEAR